MAGLKFIDTHCHLDFKEFDKDRENVIRDSREMGVRAFIIPGVTRATWRRALDLTDQYPFIKCALGLHPQFLSHHDETDLDLLEESVSSHRSNIVALGEFGLDFYDSDTIHDRQKRYFEAQLHLAKKLRLPVVLHVRKAHDQVLKVIRAIRFDQGGIIHCYSGSEQQARRYLDFGFKLGIGGVITYDRARRLHRIARSFEASAFVLETDSPDIPIQGSEQSRNSPEMIPNIFTALSKYRPESIEDLASQLLNNSITLFPSLERFIND